MRNGRKEAEKSQAVVRVPYSPPRISSSQAFERLALGCNGTQDELGDLFPKPGFTSCTTTGAS